MKNQVTQYTASHRIKIPLKMFRMPTHTFNTLIITLGLCWPNRELWLLFQQIISGFHYNWEIQDNFINLLCNIKKRSETGTFTAIQGVNMEICEL